MSTLRTLNEAALSHAVHVTGEPRSLLAVAIQAYLDGLTLEKSSKNPRVNRLAAMSVGQRIQRYPLDNTGYIQSYYIRQAQVMLGNPDARWRVVGEKTVERTA